MVLVRYLAVGCWDPSGTAVLPSQGHPTSGFEGRGILGRRPPMSPKPLASVGTGTAPRWCEVVELALSA